MQRVGSEVLRPAGKRGKPRSGRSAAVGVPVAALLLFLTLLAWSAHSFWHFSAVEHGFQIITTAESDGHSVERRQLGAGSGGSGSGGLLEDGLLATAAAGDGAGNAGASDMSDGSSGVGAGSTSHRARSWLPAALLWAEEHHKQRLKQQATVYQEPTGCGLVPCGAQQLRRPHTLVVYTYAAGGLQPNMGHAAALHHMPCRRHACPCHSATYAHTGCPARRGL